MSNPRLLLDAGNARLKWAVVDDQRWLAQGVAEYSDLTELAKWLEPVTHACMASVARDADEKQLADMLASRNIVLQRLAVAPQFAGVRNCYQGPARLGVDRWMALIAARERTQTAVLVVSAGTAMTVDALSAQGDFLGGLIVPGLRLMRQALQQGTAGVGEVGAAELEPFPVSTATAVASGTLLALCGAIRLQHARLAAQTGDVPACLITGGDATALLPVLELTAELVPTLILEGIERVTREHDTP
jgi:type III pantothenate kinase